MKKILKNQSGYIMLESLIVYLITLVLLFFILAVFCVMFQRWNIQIIANNTATSIAQSYRFKNADTMSGYTDKDEINNVDIWRYVWGHDAEMDEAAEENSQHYIIERLARTTFTHEVSDPVITVDVEKDCLRRRHVNVTISGEYAVPLRAIMEPLGFASTTKYTVTGSAECLDLMEYLIMSDYENRMLKPGGLIKSETVSFVDSFLKLVNHGIKHFTDEDDS